MFFMAEQTDGKERPLVMENGKLHLLYKVITEWERKSISHS